jgi:RNA polymerase sigma-70 factor (ECF subfamily)
VPTAIDETARRRTFEEWVKAHTADLFRFARNRVKDPDDAEDLVQVALVSAWESLDRYQGESSPRTWLFAILKHKLLDHYRKSYREAERLSGRESGSDDPVEQFFDQEGHWNSGHAPKDIALFHQDDQSEKLDRALRHCLDALPEHLRAAVEMKYLQDMEGARIQEALGLSEANYWQQVHRAKLKLRACIEQRLKPTRE